MKFFHSGGYIQGLSIIVSPLAHIHPQLLVHAWKQAVYHASRHHFRLVLFGYILTQTSKALECRICHDHISLTVQQSRSRSHAPTPKDSPISQTLEVFDHTVHLFGLPVSKGNRVFMLVLSTTHKIKTS